MIPGRKTSDGCCSRIIIILKKEKKKFQPVLGSRHVYSYVSVALQVLNKKNAAVDSVSCFINRMSTVFKPPCKSYPDKGRRVFNNLKHRYLYKNKNRNIFLSIVLQRWNSALLTILYSFLKTILKR